MFGWDELTQKVAQAWQNLTPEQQKQTIIFADNYGEAGAIHHYGKLYNLPDVVSLNSSFALWAPDSLTCKYIIYVDERGQNAIKLLASHQIGSYKKVGQIDNPLAREHGTVITLFTDVKPALYQLYCNDLAKTRLE
jgi:hypothetical protein